jgi:hypothetical protein
MPATYAATTNSEAMPATYAATTDLGWGHVVDVIITCLAEVVLQGDSNVECIKSIIAPASIQLTFVISCPLVIWSNVLHAQSMTQLEYK